MKNRLSPQFAATKNAQATLDRLAQNVKVEYAPPKFCKDCEWHTCRYNDTKEKVIHGCRCPPLLNKITGEPSNPAANRNNAISCGPVARYFSPKPEQKKEPAG